MKIKFLGHSCFMITTDKGMKIITDPYHTGQEFHLSDIQESADVVTLSHEHPDHNNFEAVKGNPRVLRKSTLVRGIDFSAVESYHDNAGGKERGSNLIFTFEVDGIKLCHLGDLGHQLNNSQLTAIGKVDILFVPIGGGFTIDAAGAEKVCEDIGARVIIPMHYKTAGLPFLADIEDFLRGKKNVTQRSNSILELTCQNLPKSSQIIVLKPELLTY
jgi:L-ascorbate metabolism protein UlaG (beta-lactamase superfamily)